MTNQHCPGFESNKKLDEITVTCPSCKKTWEIFSDELGKNVKCPACAAVFDPKSCKCSK